MTTAAIQLLSIASQAVSAGRQSSGLLGSSDASGSDGSSDQLGFAMALEQSSANQAGSGMADDQSPQQDPCENHAFSDGQEDAGSGQARRKTESESGSADAASDSAVQEPQPVEGVTEEEELADLDSEADLVEVLVTPKDQPAEQDATVLAEAMAAIDLSGQVVPVVQAPVIEVEASGSSVGESSPPASDAATFSFAVGADAQADAAALRQQIQSVAMEQSAATVESGPGETQSSLAMPEFSAVQAADFALPTQDELDAAQPVQAFQFAADDIPVSPDVTATPAGQFQSMDDISIDDSAVPEVVAQMSPVSSTRSVVEQAQDGLAAPEVVAQMSPASSTRSVVEQAQLDAAEFVADAISTAEPADSDARLLAVAAAGAADAVSDESLAVDDMSAAESQDIDVRDVLQASADQTLSDAPSARNVDVAGRSARAIAMGSAVAGDSAMQDGAESTDFQIEDFTADESASSSPAVFPSAGRMAASDEPASQTAGAMEVRDSVMSGAVVETAAEMADVSAVNASALPSSSGAIREQVALGLEGAVKTHAAIAADGVSTSQQIVIRLNPPELGRVRVTLQSDESGGVSGVLEVQNPRTLNALKSEADALVDRLSQMAGVVQVRRIEVVPEQSQSDSRGWDGASSWSQQNGANANAWSQHQAEQSQYASVGADAAGEQETQNAYSQSGRTIISDESINVWI